MDRTDLTLFVSLLAGQLRLLAIQPSEGSIPAAPAKLRGSAAGEG